MLVKRLTLAAGVETAFEFDEYAAKSVVVKNETAGEIQFCDGPFDAAKAAHIPAFSWQALDVRMFPSEQPRFYVKAVSAGAVEIDFGSTGMGQMGHVLDVAGQIPHTLTLTATEGTTIAASLVRLHGQTLDLTEPVTLTTGATVFNGDVVSLSATAGVGFTPVLTINGEEVTLDQGSATYVIAGETVAAVTAVEEVAP